MITVTLLTRPGCQLCDVAKQTVLSVRQRHDFDFVLRDITSDAEDLHRYKNDIPVVLVNGEEIARHRLSAATLIAAIEGIPTKANE